MILPSACRIHLAADESGVKYDCVWYQHPKGAEPRLVATDGKILAVLPVSPSDGDHEGAVDPRAFRQACKGKKGQAVITVNGVAGLPMHGQSFALLVDRVAPDVDQVLRAAPEPRLRIALNIKALLRLANALGEDSLELTIGDHEAMVTVRPLDDRGYPSRRSPGAHGAIMPIRLEEGRAIEATEEA